MTIEDVIAAEGPRSPDVDHSQRRFNTGIVVVVEHGRSPSHELVERANDIRQQWIQYWRMTTRDRASMTTNPRCLTRQQLRICGAHLTQEARHHVRCRLSGDEHHNSSACFHRASSLSSPPTPLVLNCWTPRCKFAIRENSSMKYDPVELTTTRSNARNTNQEEESNDTREQQHRNVVVIEDEGGSSPPPFIREKSETECWKFSHEVGRLSVKKVTIANQKIQKGPTGG